MGERRRVAPVKPPESAADDTGLRDFEQALPITMLLAREAAMAHFRPMLREHGLTEQQWRVLRVIASQPGIGAGPLAQLSALLAPSLTRIVRHLEDEGLVARSAVENDQRRATFALTRRGERRVAEVAPDSEAIYRQIAERFGSDRLVKLNRMLSEFVTAVS